MHSKNFEKVKKYYDEGLWNIDMVSNVVSRPLGITVEEYKEITGFEYPAKS